MKSKRLQKIIEENIKFEREAPYNFCDRWCERCLHETQMRCRLYQDEFEQKITCIAHGRDPLDPEITERVMERQLENIEDKIEQFIEENEIDLAGAEGPEFEKIREHIKFVENNPLDITAEQYCKRAQEFLEDAFYDKKEINARLAPDFETVAWYHTLLPVKLHRALCGFHEPITEDEFALYDAVAQFAVCRKAINKSVEALRKIKPYYPNHKSLIGGLLALLNNILSRIEAMEESI